MIELRITVDDMGNVAVNGPIKQTMMCYGLLEIAKDAIRREHEEEQKKAVLSPSVADLAAFSLKNQ